MDSFNLLFVAITYLHADMLFNGYKNDRNYDDEINAGFGIR